MTNPKRRFSGRAENYARHRPGYPKAILEFLDGRGLTTGSLIADVASGTGLLSELFLGNGNRVFGVEPNREMREAGERYLGGYERFESVAGTAEATTLGDASVDLIVVGQAFHWFEPRSTRAEFERILKPGGCVALLWNDMRRDATPFMEAYERLIRAHRMEEYKPFDPEMEVRRFFEPGGFETRSFGHRQVFDLDGLTGRLLSSSYVPEAGEMGHDRMMEDLRGIFVSHEESGRVAVEYETLVYLGRLG